MQQMSDSQPQPDQSSNEKIVKLEPPSHEEIVESESAPPPDQSPSPPQIKQEISMQGINEKASDRNQQQIPEAESQIQQDQETPEEQQSSQKTIGQKSSTSTSVIRQLTASGTIITTTEPKLQLPGPGDSMSATGGEQLQIITEIANSDDYPATQYQYIQGEDGHAEILYETHQYTTLGPNSQLYDPAYASTSTQYGPYGRDDSGTSGIALAYLNNNNESITLHGTNGTYNYPETDLLQYTSSSLSEQIHYSHSGSGNNVPLLIEPFENMNQNYFRPQCVNCGNTVSPHQGQIFQDPRGNTICSNCARPLQNGRMPRQINPTRQQKKANKAAAQNRRSGVICANCKTSKTTLWRRNNNGEPVCNSCGLYYKLHGINRPASMKKDTIQTRKRKPKSTSHVTTHQLNSPAPRLQNMHPPPPAMHHHGRMMNQNNSGYQPAGDINLITAQYQQEQQPYIVTHSQNFVGQMLRGNPMPTPLQPVHVLQQQVNVGGNSQGQEEQATVITSTSTVNSVNGPYRTPDHEEDDEEDPNNNNNMQ